MAYVTAVFVSIVYELCKKVKECKNASGAKQETMFVLNMKSKLRLK